MEKEWRDVGTVDVKGGKMRRKRGNEIIRGVMSVVVFYFLFFFRSD